MVRLPGGAFRMGSDGFYAEERPVREVSVDGFLIDEHPVTVAEFRRFVKATGYVTMAEVAPTAGDYPDAEPELLVPGSLVFRQTAGPVQLDDVTAWWTWTPGADWRHPEGPGSTVDGRQLHPVTHVAYADVVAYTEWAGKQLPTEAEWEYAARGGLDGTVYPWGDDFLPSGKTMANTWQGEFPWQRRNGPPTTTPVRTFPPNGFGLYDVVGNVWEWTADLFAADRAEGGQPACCVPTNPATIPQRVIKGGSHLCAPTYCLRYRPAARQGEAIDTSTGHLGFRCILRQ